ncbi:MAG: pyrroloquinoline quinone biosynthesis protein PqqE [Pseudomonadota bacterium]
MSDAQASKTIPPPTALLAELTHRCPLSCPYCSNPVALAKKADEMAAPLWARLFEEASALGVLHAHLSGGEPAARADLETIAAAASRAGLYTNLITSGVGLGAGRLEALAAAGLDHLQLSVQAPEAALSEAIGGYAGAFAKKRAVAEAAARLDLPLTLNAVMHRRNFDGLEATIALAQAWGARRLEVATVQLHGWAARNRAALTPSEAQVLRASEIVAAAQERLRGALVIDYVPSDQFARYPKACMGGWGRVGIVVTPAGDALPCHGAQALTQLSFPNVRQTSLAEIWTRSDAFNAYRGEAWMQEPCRSCARRAVDFGGCRCQALAWTGDAAEADPGCSLSPHHARLRAAAREAAAEEPGAWMPRPNA